jgi:hypothetical protein
LSYLSPVTYRLNTLLPGSYLDEVEAVEPGWLAAQLAQVSRLEIDSRLRKRYAVPFQEPAPEAVKAWLARIVDVRVLVRRGVDPQDPQFELIRSEAETAKDELREAADGEAGLFDLPLRADTTKSGIVKGGTRSYSEASPYAWTDVQVRRGRREDCNGEGTYL